MCAHGGVTTSGSATNGKSHETAATAECLELSHDCTTFSRTHGRGEACNAPFIGVGIAPVAPAGSVPCTTFRDDPLRRVSSFPAPCCAVVSSQRCRITQAQSQYMARASHLEGVVWIASAQSIRLRFLDCISLHRPSSFAAQSSQAIAVVFPHSTTSPEKPHTDRSTSARTGGARRTEGLAHRDPEGLPVAAGFHPGCGWSAPAPAGADAGAPRCPKGSVVHSFGLYTAELLLRWGLGDPGLDSAYNSG